MACNKLLMLTIVAIFLPAMAMATDYIVGDDSGWTINFDYQAWAKDKVFYLGDKLVFQYPQGNHNVFKVNGTAFKNCDVPPTDEALTSGNDTIVLATPGRKWYICGVGNHCASYGQKLFITVQFQYGWAPIPEPWPPAPTPEPWAPISHLAPAPTPEPWAPISHLAPAPTPEPWAPITPSMPRKMVTEPWAPAPTPSAPAPSSSDAPWWPLSPSPSSSDAPWWPLSLSPSLSPYPWN